MKKNDILLLILISLFSLPIFFLVDGYRDDFVRNYNGDMIWQREGRPFSYIILYVLNLGGKITNPFPLAQIASIAIMFLTCRRLSNEFNIKNKTLASLISALLFLTPFFIQNLSYQYDSLPMVASVSMAAIAGISGRVFIKFTLLFLSISTYQSALPVFFIFEGVRYFNHGNSKNILISMAIAAVTLLLYKMVVIKYFVYSDYATNASRMLNPFSYDGIYSFFSNVNYYVSYFYSYYKPIPLIIYTSIVLISLAILLLKWNKSVGFISAASIISSILIFCIIDEYRLYVQPRVFVWSGALLVMCFYIITKSTENIRAKTTRVISVLVCILLVYAISISCIYSYAYKKSIETDIENMNLILSSINDNDGTILFSGSPIKSDIEERAINKYKFLDEVIGEKLTSWYSWYYFRNFGLNVNVRKAVDEEYPDCKDVVSKVNNNYMIYKTKENYIVFFGDVKCK